VEDNGRGSRSGTKLMLSENEGALHKDAEIITDMIKQRNGFSENCISSVEFSILVFSSVTRNNFRKDKQL
jgi:hypothetical protein